MSAAIALIFLAEASANCAPADTNRLRAGASVVQAIVTVEPQSFEPPAATTAALNEPADGEDSSGSAEAQEPDEADQPADQCPALPLPIA
jgi:hypothetical protein